MSRGKPYSRVDRTAFARYIKRALADRSASLKPSVQGTEEAKYEALLGALFIQIGQTTMPGSSRKTFDRLVAETGAPRAVHVWHFGQALRRMGVSWSSGPLALAACKCDIHLLGVLGHLASMTRLGPPLVPLLVDAPYERQLSAILTEPEIWEFDHVKKALRTRRTETPERAFEDARNRVKRELSGVRTRISLRGLQDKPTRSTSAFSKVPIHRLAFPQRFRTAASALYDNIASRHFNYDLVRAATANRHKTMRSFVVPTKLLDLLDLAWEKWYLNPEGADTPARISEIINDLALFVREPPDKYRVDSAWAEYRSFLGRLRRLKRARSINFKLQLMSSSEFKKYQDKEREEMIKRLSKLDIASINHRQLSRVPL